jgi:hypothetical protein
VNDSSKLLDAEHEELARRAAVDAGLPEEFWAGSGA